MISIQLAVRKTCAEVFEAVLTKASRVLAPANGLE